MSEVQALRRDCAEKRTAYHHSRCVFDEALRLGVYAISDMSALRSELEQNLVAYYAAHSALHDRMKRDGLPPKPLRAILN